MNYAQIKPTELQMLWKLVKSKLVKSGEKRPLSAADLVLLFPKDLLDLWTGRSGLKRYDQRNFYGE
jgi:hypothetical protein